MTSGGPRRPVLSRRILKWAATRLGAPGLTADAAGLLLDRVHHRGARAARRRYRRQARAALWRLVFSTRRLEKGPKRNRMAGLPLDAKLAVRMLARFPGLIVSGIALFLSLAGIYAVMAFAVARRAREVGVRVALGGNTSRVLQEIFRKRLRRIGTGVLLGCASMGILAWVLTDGRLAARDGTLLLALGVGLLAVCSLACVAPARRALRVEPAEALSAEE